MKKARKRGANRKGITTQGLFNFSFLSGLFLGIFISFIIFVWKDEIDLSFLKKENANENSTYLGSLKKNQPTPEDYKNSPTFYKFLATEKVPLPKDDSSENKNSDITEIGSEKFYLQIGSFKSRKDADARKAQLALLGIFTKIKETKNRVGGKWYRVQLGPVSRTSARDLRKRIYTAGFEVLVTKK